MLLRAALCLLLFAPLAARADDVNRLSPPPPPPPPPELPEPRAPAPRVEIDDDSAPKPELSPEEHYDEGFGKRTMIKATFGLISLSLGVGLYVLGNDRSFCGGVLCGLVFASMSVVFFTPFAIWLGARAVGAPGGYWWTVLGAVPGWILTMVIFAATNTDFRTNPISFVSWVLPVATGLLVHELTAEPRTKPWFSAWADPRGGGGVAVTLDF